MFNLIFGTNDLQEVMEVWPQKLLFPLRGYSKAKQRAIFQPVPNLDAFIIVDQNASVSRYRPTHSEWEYLGMEWVMNTKEEVMHLHDKLENDSDFEACLGSQFGQGGIVHYDNANNPFFLTNADDNETMIVEPIGYDAETLPENLQLNVTIRVPDIVRAFAFYSKRGFVSSCPLQVETLSARAVFSLEAVKGFSITLEQLQDESAFKGYYTGCIVDITADSTELFEQLVTTYRKTGAILSSVSESSRYERHHHVTAPSINMRISESIAR